MRQTELRLAMRDRRAIEVLRSKGWHSDVGRASRLPRSRRAAECRVAETRVAGVKRAGVVRHRGVHDLGILDTGGLNHSRNEAEVPGRHVAGPQPGERASLDGV
jgi:hypothetical protein